MAFVNQHGIFILCIMETKLVDCHCSQAKSCTRTNEAYITVDYVIRRRHYIIQLTQIMSFSFVRETGMFVVVPVLSQILNAIGECV